jgi:hypothetical protein
MPRTSARGPLTVLSFLTEEPRSTSDIYAIVGYETLMRAGLIPYPAFRAALAELETAGLAQSGSDEDGATIWSLTAAGAARVPPSGQS